MRITFEPTEGVRGEEFQQHRVIIELPGDDRDIQEVGELVRYALLAWGFHHENVDELIPIL